MGFGSRDEIGIPSATPLVSMPVSVPIDNTPYSPMAMFALKVYVFGGLAFMVGIVVSAVMFWIWTVIIKREYANSPPWLELHPERMREKEKARIARLKQKKADKKEERKRRQQETFNEKIIPPPLRFLRKGNRNRSSSLPVIRPNDQDPPTPIQASTPKPRKSSFSTSPSKGGKRVSWASSTSELDPDGHTSEKPIEENGALPRKRASSVSSLLPIPALQNISESYRSFDEPSTNSTRRRASSFSHFQPDGKVLECPSPVPRARTSISHTNIAVEPHSRRGQEMIAATTPEIVGRWATTNDPLVDNPLISHFASKDDNSQ